MDYRGWRVNGHADSLLLKNGCPVLCGWVAVCVFLAVYAETAKSPGLEEAICQREQSRWSPVIFLQPESVEQERFGPWLEIGFSGTFWKMTARNNPIKEIG